MHVKENARDRKENKDRIHNKGVQSKFHASGVDQTCHHVGSTRSLHNTSDRSSGQERK